MKNTISLLLFYFLLLVGAGCNKEKSELPNIVLILADDLGTGDVGAYNPASGIPTPNMDRIAKEGIMFSDAHTGSAVCTPTRYGIITGRYCWRTRLKRGVLNGYGEHLIEAGRTTISSLLREKGYYTAGIGKWHLGMDFAKDSSGTVDYYGKINFSPITNGFDYFYGIAASLDFPPYVYIENDHFTMIPAEEQEKLGFPRYLRKGPKASDFDFETAWEHLTHKAKTVIGKQSGKNPLFLYFALPSPHKPVWPDSRFVGQTKLGPYGDFVHQTDHIIGEVVSALEKGGILDNTLLILTSDNGSFMYRINDTIPADHLIDERVQGYYTANHQSNFYYRGTKADIWEAGHRVPFLVQWPGRIGKGKTIDETICTTDFMATFAEIIDRDLADNEGEDSFSILPLLFGYINNFSRAPVVNHSSAGMFAIRDGSYKLIAGNGSGGRQHPRGKPWGEPFMLYDLSSDLSETEDIIEENEDLAEDMRNTLERIIESGSSKNY